MTIKSYERIYKKYWTLEEIEEDLGLERSVILRTLNRWKAKYGTQTRSIRISKELYQCLELHVRYDGIISYKGLREMVAGTLIVSVIKR